MPIRFKNHQDKILEVYTYVVNENNSSNYYSNNNRKVKVYFVAAYTKDEAIDIIIDKISDLKWVEKTREDYKRQDYWEAWLDHNRDKEYRKYQKAVKKQRDKINDYIMYIDNTSYSGKKGIFKISTIYV